MPPGNQHTTGERHQDAQTSLMSLARLFARQAAAELMSPSASKGAILSSVPTTSEEQGDAPSSD
jgi:hypothetical protein